MKKILLAALVVSSAFIVAGCPDAGEALIGNDNPRVKAVNAISGVPVDATVSDNNGEQQILNNASFGDVSTSAILNNGNSNVVFRNANTGTVISQRAVLFELNHSYTVAAFGPAGANNMVVAGDSITPGLNNAGVRFLQASGSAAPLDIYIGGPGSTVLTATKIRDDLASGTAMLYREVQAGSRRVFITPANSQVVEATADYDLVAGRLYSIVIGSNGGRTLVMVEEN